jgi:cytoskeletal protein CcmA (bactofilin family)
MSILKGSAHLSRKKIQPVGWDRAMRLLMTFVIFAFIVGCPTARSSQAKADALTGNWRGSNGGLSVTITLRQAADSVTGSGNFRVATNASIGCGGESLPASGGDYLGAAGNQNIGGRIHGSIRAAGGEIHVSGTVDRNATIAGGSVTLDSTADIASNAYLVGGNVWVNGAVRGNLLASAGNVTLNGTVGRDVEVRGGELRIGPHAVITGNLRYRVPAGKVHIDSAARISGKVTALPVSRGWSLTRWLWTLGFLVVGAVVVALLPRFTERAAETIPGRPVRSGLVGLGAFILIPFAIFIAAVTVIGLPLAIATALLYGVVVYLSTVPVALWMGRLLLGARGRAGRQGALLSFLVGGILVLVVQVIPVVGPIVMGVAVCVGFGAILLQTLAVRRQAAAV